MEAVCSSRTSVDFQRSMRISFDDKCVPRLQSIRGDEKVLVNKCTRYLLRSLNEIMQRSRDACPIAGASKVHSSV
ncbi:hypothetical protein B7P43_G17894 [Cryptotermes secundus]|uniref:Uncharacterized protein n=1 Tax=Cryptotermes secundus TaxID=105785 RepID=A0A2J7PNR1_9NEOP|nr:hypothetical protein B7P43_G17894 [Cryptotermes secundus]